MVPFRLHIYAFIFYRKLRNTKIVSPASNEEVADDGISSEDEDGIEAEVSWYESEPEFDDLSDTNCETNGNYTESEEEVGSVRQEV